MKTLYKRAIAITLVLVGILGYYLAYQPRHCSYPNLTRSDLDFLYVGIAPKEVTDRLGTPQPGSLYLYEYSLRNGEQVVLRFSGSGTQGLGGGWIVKQNGNRVDFFTGQRLNPHTYEDFHFLYYGIRYTEIIETLGEPNIEYGSGQHMALYELDDGQIVVLVLGARIEQEQVDYIVIEAYLSSKTDEPLISLF